MKKIVPLIVFLFLFFTPVFAAFNSPIEIIIDSQPDSPLQISNPVPKFEIVKEINRKELNMLSINLMTKNASQKTIRSFTFIIYAELVTTENICPNSPKGLLQINQQRAAEINLGSYDDQSARIVEITVDFVEFTDGTTWGVDKSESRQTLGGLRAGAKVGQEYLQKINNEKGISAVIKAADEIQKNLQPDNPNEKWRRGFKVGLRTLCNHINEIYKKEGVKGVEIELQKAQFLPV